VEQSTFTENIAAIKKLVDWADERNEQLREVEVGNIRILFEPDPIGKRERHLQALRENHDQHIDELETANEILSQNAYQAIAKSFSAFEPDDE
jgi:DNA-binding transcriptional MerR regulator